MNQIMNESGLQALLDSLETVLKRPIAMPSGINAQITSITNILSNMPKEQFESFYPQFVRVSHRYMSRVPPNDQLFNLLVSTPNIRASTTLLSLKALFVHVCRGRSPDRQLQMLVQFVLQLFDDLPSNLFDIEYVILLQEALSYIPQLFKLSKSPYLDAFRSKIFNLMKELLQAECLFKTENVSVEYISLILKGIKFLTEFGTQEMRNSLPNLCLFVLNFCCKNYLKLYKDVCQVVVYLTCTFKDIFRQYVPVILCFFVENPQVFTLQATFDIVSNYKTFFNQKLMESAFKNMQNVIYNQDLFSLSSDLSFESYKVLISGCNRISDALKDSMDQEIKTKLLDIHFRLFSTFTEIISTEYGNILNRNLCTSQNYYQESGFNDKNSAYKFINYFPSENCLLEAFSHLNNKKSMIISKNRPTSNRNTCQDLSKQYLDNHCYFCSNIEIDRSTITKNSIKSIENAKYLILQLIKSMKSLFSVKNLPTQNFDPQKSSTNHSGSLIDNATIENMQNNSELFTLQQIFRDIVYLYSLQIFQKDLNEFFETLKSFLNILKPGDIKSIVSTNVLHLIEHLERPYIIKSSLYRVHCSDGHLFIKKSFLKSYDEILNRKNTSDVLKEKSVNQEDNFYLASNITKKPTDDQQMVTTNRYKTKNSIDDKFDDTTHLSFICKDIVSQAIKSATAPKTKLPDFKYFCCCDHQYFLTTFKDLDVSISDDSVMRCCEEHRLLDFSTMFPTVPRLSKCKCYSCLTRKFLKDSYSCLSMVFELLVSFDFLFDIFFEAVHYYYKMNLVSSEIDHEIAETNQQTFWHIKNNQNIQNVESDPQTQQKTQNFNLSNHDTRNTEHMDLNPETQSNAATNTSINHKSGGDLQTHSMDTFNIHFHPETKNIQKLDGDLKTHSSNTINNNFNINIDSRKPSIYSPNTNYPPQLRRSHKSEVPGTCFHMYPTYTLDVLDLLSILRPSILEPIASDLILTHPNALLRILQLPEIPDRVLSALEDSLFDISNSCVGLFYKTGNPLYVCIFLHLPRVSQSIYSVFNDNVTPEPLENAKDLQKATSKGSSTLGFNSESTTYDLNFDSNSASILKNIAEDTNTAAIPEDIVNENDSIGLRQNIKVSGNSESRSTLLSTLGDRLKPTNDIYAGKINQPQCSSTQNYFMYSKFLTYLVCEYDVCRFKCLIPYLSFFASFFIFQSSEDFDSMFLVDFSAVLIIFKKLISKHEKKSKIDNKEHRVSLDKGTNSIHTNRCPSNIHPNIDTRAFVSNAFIFYDSEKEPLFSSKVYSILRESLCSNYSNTPWDRFVCLTESELVDFLMRRIPESYFKRNVFNLSNLSLLVPFCSYLLSDVEFQLSFLPYNSCYDHYSSFHDRKHFACSEYENLIEKNFQKSFYKENDKLKFDNLIENDPQNKSKRDEIIFQRDAIDTTSDKHTRNKNQICRNTFENKGAFEVDSHNEYVTFKNAANDDSTYDFPLASNSYENKTNIPLSSLNSSNSNLLGLSTHDFSDGAAVCKCKQSPVLHTVYIFLTTFLAKSLGWGDKDICKISDRTLEHLISIQKNGALVTEFRCFLTAFQNKSSNFQRLTNPTKYEMYSDILNVGLAMKGILQLCGCIRSQRVTSPFIETENYHKDFVVPFNPQNFFPSSENKVGKISGEPTDQSPNIPSKSQNTGLYNIYKKFYKNSKSVTAENNLKRLTNDSTRLVGKSDLLNESHYKNDDSSFFAHQNRYYVPKMCLDFLKLVIQQIVFYKICVIFRVHCYHRRVHFDYQTFLDPLLENFSYYYPCDPAIYDSDQRETNLISCINNFYDNEDSIKAQSTTLTKNSDQNHSNLTKTDTRTFVRDIDKSHKTPINSHLTTPISDGSGIEYLDAQYPYSFDKNSKCVVEHVLDEGFSILSQFCQSYYLMNATNFFPDILAKFQTFVQDCDFKKRKAGINGICYVLKKIGPNKCFIECSIILQSVLNYLIIELESSGYTKMVKEDSRKIFNSVGARSLSICFRVVDILVSVLTDHSRVLKFFSERVMSDSNEIYQLCRYGIESVYRHKNLNTYLKVSGIEYKRQISRGIDYRNDNLNAKYRVEYLNKETDMDDKTSIQDKINLKDNGRIDEKSEIKDEADIGHQVNVESNKTVHDVINQESVYNLLSNHPTSVTNSSILENEYILKNSDDTPKNIYPPDLPSFITDLVNKSTKFSISGLSFCVEHNKKSKKILNDLLEKSNIDEWEAINMIHSFKKIIHMEFQKSFVDLDFVFDLVKSICYVSKLFLLKSGAYLLQYVITNLSKADSLIKSAKRTHEYETNLATAFDSKEPCNNTNEIHPDNKFRLNGFKDDINRADTFGNNELIYRSEETDLSNNQRIDTFSNFRNEVVHFIKFYFQLEDSMNQLKMVKLFGIIFGYITADMLGVLKLNSIHKCNDVIIIIQRLKCIDYATFCVYLQAIQHLNKFKGNTIKHKNEGNELLASKKGDISSVFNEENASSHKNEGNVSSFKNAGNPLSKRRDDKTNNIAFKYDYKYDLLSTDSVVSLDVLCAYSIHNTFVINSPSILDFVYQMNFFISFKKILYLFNESFNDCSLVSHSLAEGRDISILQFFFNSHYKPNHIETKVGKHQLQFHPSTNKDKDSSNSAFQDLNPLISSSMHPHFSYSPNEQPNPPGFPINNKEKSIFSNHDMISPIMHSNLPGSSNQNEDVSTPSNQCFNTHNSLNQGKNSPSFADQKARSLNTMNCYTNRNQYTNSPIHYIRHSEEPPVYFDAFEKFLQVFCQSMENIKNAQIYHHFYYNRSFWYNLLKYVNGSSQCLELLLNVMPYKIVDKFFIREFISIDNISERSADKILQSLNSIYKIESRHRKKDQGKFLKKNDCIQSIRSGSSLSKDFICIPLNDYSFEDSTKGEFGINTPIKYCSFGDGLFEEDSFCGTEILYFLNNKFFSHRLHLGCHTELTIGSKQFMLEFGCDDQCISQNIQNSNKFSNDTNFHDIIPNFLDYLKDLIVLKCLRVLLGRFDCDIDDHEDRLLLRSLIKLTGKKFDKVNSMILSIFSKQKVKIGKKTRCYLHDSLSHINKKSETKFIKSRINGSGGLQSNRFNSSSFDSGCPQTHKTNPASIRSDNHGSDLSNSRATISNDFNSSKVISNSGRSSSVKSDESKPNKSKENDVSDSGFFDDISGYSLNDLAREMIGEEKFMQICFEYLCFSDPDESYLVPLVHSHGDFGKNVVRSLDHLLNMHQKNLIQKDLKALSLRYKNHQADLSINRYSSYGKLQKNLCKKISNYNISDSTRREFGCSKLTHAHFDGRMCDALLNDAIFKILLTDAISATSYSDILASLCSLFFQVNSYVSSLISSNNFQSVSKVFEDFLSNVLYFRNHINTLFPSLVKNFSLINENITYAVFDTALKMINPSRPQYVWMGTEMMHAIYKRFKDDLESIQLDHLPEIDFKAKFSTDMSGRINSHSYSNTGPQVDNQFNKRDGMNPYCNIGSQIDGQFDNGIRSQVGEQSNGRNGINYNSGVGNQTNSQFSELNTANSCIDVRNKIYGEYSSNINNQSNIKIQPGLHVQPIALSNNRTFPNKSHHGINSSTASMSTHTAKNPQSNTPFLEDLQVFLKNGYAALNHCYLHNKECKFSIWHNRMDINIAIREESLISARIPEVLDNQIIEIFTNKRVQAATNILRNLRSVRACKEVPIDIQHSIRGDDFNTRLNRDTNSSQIIHPNLFTNQQLFFSQSGFRRHDEGHQQHLISDGRTNTNTKVNLKKHSGYLGDRSNHSYGFNSVPPVNKHIGSVNYLTGSECVYTGCMSHDIFFDPIRIAFMLEDPLHVQFESRNSEYSSEIIKTLRSHLLLNDECVNSFLVKYIDLGTLIQIVQYNCSKQINHNSVYIITKHLLRLSMASEENDIKKTDGRLRKTHSLVSKPVLDTFRATNNGDNQDLGHKIGPAHNKLLSDTGKALENTPSPDVQYLSHLAHTDNNTSGSTLDCIIPIDENFLESEQTQGSLKNEPSCKATQVHGRYVDPGLYSSTASNAIFTKDSGSGPSGFNITVQDIKNHPTSKCFDSSNGFVSENSHCNYYKAVVELISSYNKSAREIPVEATYILTEHCLANLVNISIDFLIIEKAFGMCEDLMDIYYKMSRNTEFLQILMKIVSVDYSFHFERYLDILESQNVSTTEKVQFINLISRVISKEEVSSNKRSIRRRYINENTVNPIYTYEGFVGFIEKYQIGHEYMNRDRLGRAFMGPSHINRRRLSTKHPSHDFFEFFSADARFNFDTHQVLERDHNISKNIHERIKQQIEETISRSYKQTLKSITSHNRHVNRLSHRWTSKCNFIYGRYLNRHSSLWYYHRKFDKYDTDSDLHARNNNMDKASRCQTSDPGIKPHCPKNITCKSTDCYYCTKSLLNCNTNRESNFYSKSADSGWNSDFELCSHCVSGLGRLHVPLKAGLAPSKDHTTFHLRMLQFFKKHSETRPLLQHAYLQATLSKNILINKIYAEYFSNSISTSFYNKFKYLLNFNPLETNNEYLITKTINQKLEITTKKRYTTGDDSYYDGMFENFQKYSLVKIKECEVVDKINKFKNNVRRFNRKCVSESVNDLLLYHTLLTDRDRQGGLVNYKYDPMSDECMDINEIPTFSNVESILFTGNNNFKQVISDDPAYYNRTLGLDIKNSLTRNCLSFNGSHGLEPVFGISWINANYTPYDKHSFRFDGGSKYFSKQLIQDSQITHKSAQYIPTVLQKIHPSLSNYDTLLKTKVFKKILKKNLKTTTTKEKLNLIEETIKNIQDNSAASFLIQGWAEYVREISKQRKKRKTKLSFDLRKMLNRKRDDVFQQLLATKNGSEDFRLTGKNYSPSDVDLQKETYFSSGPDPQNPNLQNDSELHQQLRDSKLSDWGNSRSNLHTRLSQVDNIQRDLGSRCRLISNSTLTNKQKRSLKADDNLQPSYDRNKLYSEDIVGSRHSGQYFCNQKTVKLNTKESNNKYLINIIKKHFQQSNFIEIANKTNQHELMLTLINDKSQIYKEINEEDLANGFNKSKNEEIGNTVIRKQFKTAKQLIENDFNENEDEWIRITKKMQEWDLLEEISRIRGNAKLNTESLYAKMALSINQNKKDRLKKKGSVKEYNFVDDIQTVSTVCNTSQNTSGTSTISLHDDSQNITSSLSGVNNAGLMPNRVQNFSCSRSQSQNTDFIYEDMPFKDVSTIKNILKIRRDTLDKQFMEIIIQKIEIRNEDKEILTKFYKTHPKNAKIQNYKPNDQFDGSMDYNADGNRHNDNRDMINSYKHTMNRNQIQTPSFNVPKVQNNSPAVLHHSKMYIPPLNKSTSQKNTPLTNQSNISPTISHNNQLLLGIGKKQKTSMNRSKTPGFQNSHASAIINANQGNIESKSVYQPNNSHVIQNNRLSLQNSLASQQNNPYTLQNNNGPMLLDTGNIFPKGLSYQQNITNTIQNSPHILHSATSGEQNNSHITKNRNLNIHGVSNRSIITNIHGLSRNFNSMQSTNPTHHSTRSNSPYIQKIHPNHTSPNLLPTSRNKQHQDINKTNTYHNNTIDLDGNNTMNQKMPQNRSNIYLQKNFKSNCTRQESIASPDKHALHRPQNITPIQNRFHYSQSINQMEQNIKTRQHINLYEMNQSRQITTSPARFHGNTHSMNGFPNNTSIEEHSYGDHIQEINQSPNSTSVAKRPYQDMNTQESGYIYNSNQVRKFANLSQSFVPPTINQHNQQINIENPIQTRESFPINQIKQNTVSKNQQYAFHPVKNNPLQNQAVKSGLVLNTMQNIPSADQPPNLVNKNLALLNQHQNNHLINQPSNQVQSNATLQSKFQNNLSPKQLPNVPQLSGIGQNSMQNHRSSPYIEKKNLSMYQVDQKNPRLIRFLNNIQPDQTIQTSSSPHKPNGGALSNHHHTNISPNGLNKTTIQNQMQFSNFLHKNKEFSDIPPIDSPINQNTCDFSPHILTRNTQLNQSKQNHTQFNQQKSFIEPNQFQQRLNQQNRTYGSIQPNQPGNNVALDQHKSIYDQKNTLRRIFYLLQNPSRTNFVSKILLLRQKYIETLDKCKMFKKAAKNYNNRIKVLENILLDEFCLLFDVQRTDMNINNYFGSNQEFNLLDQIFAKNKIIQETGIFDYRKIAMHKKNHTQDICAKVGSMITSLIQDTFESSDSPFFQFSKNIYQQLQISLLSRRICLNLNKSPILHSLNTSIKDISCASGVGNLPIKSPDILTTEQLLASLNENDNLLLLVSENTYLMSNLDIREDEDLETAEIKLLYLLEFAPGHKKPAVYNAYAKKLMQENLNEQALFYLQKIFLLQNITISDIFEKIITEIQALRNLKLYKNALSTVNGVNVSSFNSKQRAEIIKIKAELLTKLQVGLKKPTSQKHDKGENSISDASEEKESSYEFINEDIDFLFYSASRLSDSHDIWYSWGVYLDDQYEKLSNQNSGLQKDDNITFDEIRCLDTGLKETVDQVTHPNTNGLPENANMIDINLHTLNASNKIPSSGSHPNDRFSCNNKQATYGNDAEIHKNQTHIINSSSPNRKELTENLAYVQNKATNDFNQNRNSDHLQKIINQNFLLSSSTYSPDQRDLENTYPNTIQQVSKFKNRCSDIKPNNDHIQNFQNKTLDNIGHLKRDSHSRNENFLNDKNTDEGYLNPCSVNDELNRHLESPQLKLAHIGDNAQDTIRSDDDLHHPDFSSRNSNTSLTNAYQYEIKNHTLDQKTKSTNDPLVISHEKNQKPPDGVVSDNFTNQYNKTISPSDFIALDHKTSEASSKECQKSQKLFKQAFSTLLHASLSPDSHISRKALLRLIKYIKYADSEMCNELSIYLPQIQIGRLIFFAPQYIDLLSLSKSDAASLILTSIIQKYPQAIFLDLKTQVDRKKQIVNLIKQSDTCKDVFESLNDNACLKYECKEYEQHANNSMVDNLNNIPFPRSTIPKSYETSIPANTNEFKGDQATTFTNVENEKLSEKFYSDLSDKLKTTEKKSSCGDSVYIDPKIPQKSWKTSLENSKTFDLEGAVPHRLSHLLGKFNLCDLHAIYKLVKIADNLVKSLENSAEENCYRVSNAMFIHAVTTIHNKDPSQTSKLSQTVYRFLNYLISSKINKKYVQEFYHDFFIQRKNPKRSNKTTKRLEKTSKGSSLQQFNMEINIKSKSPVNSTLNEIHDSYGTDIPKYINKIPFLDDSKLNTRATKAGFDSSKSNQQSLNIQSDQKEIHKNPSSDKYIHESKKLKKGSKWLENGEIVKISKKASRKLTLLEFTYLAKKWALVCENILRTINYTVDLSHLHSGNSYRAPNLPKIEVFGQYTELKDFYSSRIYIESFNPAILYSWRNDNLIRRIEIRGSDGKIYRYAFQNCISEVYKLEDKIIQISQFLEFQSKQAIGFFPYINIAHNARIVRMNERLSFFDDILDSIKFRNSNADTELVFKYLRSINLHKIDQSHFETQNRLITKAKDNLKENSTITTSSSQKFNPKSSSTKETSEITQCSDHTDSDTVCLHDDTKLNTTKLCVNEKRASDTQISNEIDFNHGLKKPMINQISNDLKYLDSGSNNNYNGNYLEVESKNACRDLENRTTTPSPNYMNNSHPRYDESNFKFNRYSILVNDQAILEASKDIYSFEKSNRICSKHERQNLARNIENSEKNSDQNKFLFGSPVNRFEYPYSIDLHDIVRAIRSNESLIEDFVYPINKKTKLRAYRNVLKIVGSDALVNFVEEGYEESFYFIREFTQSYCLKSIFMYLTCIGKRTPNRIAFGNNSAIFYNFDLLPALQNGMIDSTEKVPFRLTPNLAKMMGSDHIRGTFYKISYEFANIFLNSDYFKEIVIACISSFDKNPIASYEKFESKLKKMYTKPDKYIARSMDPNNLSQMNPVWHPWF